MPQLLKTPHFLSATALSMVLLPTMFALAGQPPSAADSAPSESTPSDAPPRDGGTLVQLKNGTPVVQTFELYVETEDGQISRFDHRLRLAPEQTGVWRLKPGPTVKTVRKGKTTFYRVGVVGVDGDGKTSRWGLVSGVGMHGRETQTLGDSGPDSGLTFRTIHIRPIAP